VLGGKMERKLLLLDIARSIPGFVDAPSDYKIGARDGFEATMNTLRQNGLLKGKVIAPMKKKYYEVLQSGSLKDLEAEVMVYCESGWYPQGGIATSGSDNVQYVYMQAVTKDVFFLKESQ
jgi:hypothetical protein